MGGPKVIDRFVNSIKTYPVFNVSDCDLDANASHDEKFSYWVEKCNSKPRLYTAIVKND